VITVGEAMSWMEQRAIFQGRFDELNQTDTKGDAQKTKQLQAQYQQLNNDILAYLTTKAQNNNLSGLLTENGELQKQIQHLTKVQDQMKVDVESAVARDDLLRSRNAKITSHHLFLMDRPVRKGMIPYLWLIAILFIGVGLVIFKMMAPILPEDLLGRNEYGNPYTLFGLLGSMLNTKSVLASLLGAAIIVIIFLSLRIAGLFGK
jgi:hypothetical protein